MRSIFMLSILTISWFLYFAHPTDADLSVSRNLTKNVLAASTLDISNLNTVNNVNEVELFKVRGLVEGGFEVRSLRVKNEGEMKRGYVISAKITDGDEKLFENMRVRIYRDWEVLYEGALNKMFVEVTDKLEMDDLVLVIFLDQGSDVYGKEVYFDIVLKTMVDDSCGFVAEKELKNYVSTVTKVGSSI